MKLYTVTVRYTPTSERTYRHLAWDVATEVGDAAKRGYPNAHVHVEYERDSA